MTKCALITGAAKRIGACIADTLHDAGFNITVHYHHSHEAAVALTDKLNQKRPNSVICHSANLCEVHARQCLLNTHINHWGRLDALINNASRFYPTPVAEASLTQWQDLIGSNVEAPFFLSQISIKELKKTHGCIINIADFYASIPLKNSSIYSISKAALVMLTKSLATDLAPFVRVNAVSPGNILWPEDVEIDASLQQAAIDKIVMKKQGSPADIAQAVLMLIDQSYITGQTLFIDGGKHLGS